jgi:hypothetical protein
MLKLLVDTAIEGIEKQFAVLLERGTLGFHVTVFTFEF